MFQIRINKGARKNIKVPVMLRIDLRKGGCTICGSNPGRPKCLLEKVKTNYDCIMKVFDPVFSFLGFSALFRFTKRSWMADLTFNAGSVGGK